MIVRTGSKSKTKRAAIAVAAAFCLAILSMAGCRKKGLPAIATLADAAVRPMEERWKDAAARVEEAREGPVGLRAPVDVPIELKHSGDSHRFLAVQTAEWRKDGFSVPNDFAGLARLIKAGQLVELPMVGPDYVLFGVGGIANGNPMTYYDPRDGDSIPMFASDDEYHKADSELAADAAKKRDELANLQIELRQTRGRDRARRAMLLKQIAAGKAQLDAGIASAQEMTSCYQDPERRQAIADEYKALSDLASNLGGTTYDLNDPASRLAFKVRMLSFLRPQAKALLEEIASAYSQKFNRPLPVTSLVRTEEYQHQLSETNPNAARNPTPPHTTGLAFDIYYHFMDADEQTFLMNEIASLKQDGKVEALKETRDHIHVFAFADGHPPSEELISSSINEMASQPRERGSFGRRTVRAENRARRARSRRV